MGEQGNTMERGDTPPHGAFSDVRDDDERNGEDDRGGGTDPMAGLTAREREVAEDLIAGMTNKEIAERLFVSVTTVNFHVRNILAKLGLHSRRELRRFRAGDRGPVKD